MYKENDVYILRINRQRHDTQATSQTTVKGKFSRFFRRRPFRGDKFPRPGAASKSHVVTFTCQADDRHASEVAEETEGRREKTSVVKWIVFIMLLHQLLVRYYSTGTCAR